MAVAENKFTFKVRRKEDKNSLHDRALISGDVILTLSVRVPGMKNEKIASRWGEIQCNDGVAELVILEKDKLSCFAYHTSHIRRKMTETIHRLLC